MTVIRCPDTTASSAVLDRMGVLGRMAQPEEIAPLAVFLASDLGRGVTGNVLYVDAGYQVMGM